jgi:hypothetical protein
VDEFAEILQRDRYNENEGSELERRYRKGWNDAIGHALRLLATTRALREIAEAEEMDLRVKDALVGGEG